MDRSKLKKWVKFAVRWGVAVAGIWFILSKISLSDRVSVPDPQTHLPVQLKLARTTAENSASFDIVQRDGAVKNYERNQVVQKAGGEKVNLIDPATGKRGQLVEVLGNSPVAEEHGKPDLLYVRIPKADTGMVVSQGQIDGGYAVQTLFPVVEEGLGPMVRTANLSLLLAAIMVFPLTFLLTSYRWHELLKALSIHMGMARAFVLNMVGMFYNAFMPGSTGGDVLKAYYASKVTPHRTRAVMSVVIDRILGLLALILLGGVMAGYRWSISPAGDPVGHTCGRISLLSAMVMFGTALGLFVFYNPIVRKLVGLDFFMSKLPMQKQVRNAVEVMEIYRQRPILVLWSLIVSIPVHMTVVLSAMLAGQAFGLPIKPLYYFVCVPVIVLVGSIPISPQGAGVMEVTAAALIKNQGANVSHAVALTMSIRLVGILWSMLGGIFVLRGGFHAPGAVENAVTDGPLPIPPAVTEV